MGYALIERHWEGALLCSRDQQVEDQDTTDDCMEAGGRAKQEARAEEALSQVQAISACVVMKNIGKPCTGKPYARVVEGGQVNVAMTKLLRHRQTKGAATDRFDLRCGKPAFYSTYYY